MIVTQPIPGVKFAGHAIAAFSLSQLRSISGVSHALRVLGDCLTVSPRRRRVGVASLTSGHRILKQDQLQLGRFSDSADVGASALWSLLASHGQHV